MFGALDWCAAGRPRGLAFLLLPVPAATRGPVFLPGCAGGPPPIPSFRNGCAPAGFPGRQWRLLVSGSRRACLHVAPESIGVPVAAPFAACGEPTPA